LGLGLGLGLALANPNPNPNQARWGVATGVVCDVSASEVFVVG